MKLKNKRARKAVERKMAQRRKRNPIVTVRPDGGGLLGTRLLTKHWVAVRDDGHQTHLGNYSKSDVKRWAKRQGLEIRWVNPHRAQAKKSKVKNIKLKPEMTPEEIDRKIKQSARGYDLQGEPETGDAVMEMEPEAFLEFVGREDVEITNPPTSRDLRRKMAEIKIAQLEQANTKLAKRINRIRRMIES